MTDVNATLAERGAQYGKFVDHEKVTQELKHVFFGAKGRDLLPPDMAEAVETPTGIDKTLAERGARYGKFVDHAKVTQELKHVFFGAKGRHLLPPDMAEAVEMIMHKLGRIATGDHNYADSWHDIAGYAKLVDDRLQGVAK